MADKYKALREAVVVVKLVVVRVWMSSTPMKNMG